MAAQVEVLAKILYGDPAKKLYEAVDLVPLNCLVVGNRGLSTLKRYLNTSLFYLITKHKTFIRLRIVGRCMIPSQLSRGTFLI